MEKLIKFIKDEKWGVLSVCLTVLSVLIGSPFMLAAEGATVAVTEGGAQAQPGHTGAETQIPGQLFQELDRQPEVSEVTDLSSLRLTSRFLKSVPMKPYLTVSCEKQNVR